MKATLQIIVVSIAMLIILAIIVGLPIFAFIQSWWFGCLILGIYGLSFFLTWLFTDDRIDKSKEEQK